MKRKYSDDDEQRAYEAGEDCGRHGANTTNCHFTLFRERRFTAAWEAGKRDGERSAQR